MGSRIGVGLIGCGRLGREVMLPLLTARADVTVVALGDADEDAGAAARSQVPGAGLERDWRRVVERTDLGALVVALPTPLHADLAQAAISRGLPTYLEKPMAGSLAEAAAIRESWRRSPVTVAIGFNGRFHPLILDLRERVRNGAIGRPRFIRCVFSVAARPDDSWRHPSREGGGVLLDLASHHVDLVRFVLGQEFASVSAARTTAGSAEAISASAALDGGVTLSGTWASGAVDEDTIEITGDAGSLRVSRYEDLAPVRRGTAVPGVMARLRRALPSAAALRLARAKRRAPWHDPSFGASLDAFFAAVNGGPARVATVEDGWHSVRVVSAIAEAAASGRRVQLAPVLEGHVHAV